MDHFQSRKKPKRVRDVLDPTPSSGSQTPDSDANDTSESENANRSEVQVVAELKKKNHCARCNCACVLLTNAHHHRYSNNELYLWATMIVRFVFPFFMIMTLKSCTLNQTHDEWENERRPPKEVLERIYKNYPSVSLPADLTGQPIISPKGRKPPAPDVSQMYPSNPFMGWNPYLAATAMNMPPGPLYTTAGSSTTPFYPPHPTAAHSNIPQNLVTNEGTCQLSSDDDQAVKFPTIPEFLEELSANDHGSHYFTDFASGFHQHGYFSVDELADESLTAEHIVAMIPGMKDGTARVIKSKALVKVRKIKGKGKAKQ